MHAQTIPTTEQANEVVSAAARRAMRSAVAQSPLEQAIAAAKAADAECDRLSAIHDEASASAFDHGATAGLATYYRSWKEIDLGRDIAEPDPCLYVEGQARRQLTAMHWLSADGAEHVDTFTPDPIPQATLLLSEDEIHAYCDRTGADRTPLLEAFALWNSNGKGAEAREAALAAEERTSQDWERARTRLEMMCRRILDVPASSPAQVLKKLEAYARIIEECAASNLSDDEYLQTAFRSALKDLRALSKPPSPASQMLLAAE